MNKLKDKGLIVKHNIDFPLNTDNYKNNINNKNIKFIDIKNINKISDKMILNNKNLIIKYEKELGYL
jgi:hypothetical protein